MPLLRHHMVRLGYRYPVPVDPCGIMSSFWSCVWGSAWWGVRFKSRPAVGPQLFGLWADDGRFWTHTHTHTHTPIGRPPLAHFLDSFAREKFSGKPPRVVKRAAYNSREGVYKNLDRRPGQGVYLSVYRQTAVQICTGWARNMEPLGDKSWKITILSFQQSTLL